MQQRFIVTGGAGYVGSHLVDLLHRQGAQIVVIDDLRQGHRESLPQGVRLIEGNIGDRAVLDTVLAEGGWHAVFHFAALSLVGESMRQPLHYLIENAASGFTLVDACIRHRVPRFILSSTANLFGTPKRIPIDETAALDPGSPYGDSKWMIERALRWADQIHGMRYACLRYFNAAGADPNGRIGEDHNPETHLIPLAIDSALGRAGTLTVFGDDYPTPDGTCLRDYVHVSDLAQAHLCALARLDAGSVTYNLGNGTGHSVRAIIQMVERVCGCAVPWVMGPRRPGDPAALVASSALIRAEAGWVPRFDDLETIIRTAYEWRRGRPGGYSSSFETANKAPA